MDNIYINSGMIRLGQLLKIADLVETGGEAKAVVQAGEVVVNGEIETRRGRQLHHDDQVEFAGQVILVKTPILLCSDLDRTIIPNGSQAESPQARRILRELAARSEIILAYVSGRNLALLQEAITEYDLPTPRFAVGDVGSTIYEIKNNKWRPWPAWSKHIAPDWQGLCRQDIANLLTPIKSITAQEDEKQNTFKQSYYATVDLDVEELIETARGLLIDQGIKAGLIWSIDETSNGGLFDVLPAGATKLHAVQFLMQELGIGPERTVYCGDSGNDMPVLTSSLPAVLVKNATPGVRAEAVKLAGAAGNAKNLYLTQGDFLGLNGNYSAGVIEGLCHFAPELTDIISEILLEKKS